MRLINLAVHFWLEIKSAMHKEDVKITVAKLLVENILSDMIFQNKQLKLNKRK